MTPPDRPAVRVVEIRVHGVHGTPPESMLDDPFPVQVAGDDSARFLRRRAWCRDGPHVLEAFHWGRFTSGSPTRALWLVLAPFAILNLASFTLLPVGDEDGRRGAAPDAASPSEDPAGWAVRLLIRLLGVVLTAMLVLAVARTAMDLVMHQCAAVEACRRDNRWLGAVALDGDGGRFLVGLGPPAVVITFLWWLGRQSFLYEPPGRPDDPGWDDTLGDRGFWHTTRLTAPLRSAHVTVACAVLGALCVAYLGGERAGAQPVIAPARWLPVAFLVLAAAALVAVVRPEWFVADTHPGGIRWPPPARRARLLTGVRWASLVLLVATAVYAAATTWSATPVGPVGAVPTARAPLPGFAVAADAVMSASAALLVLLLAGCVVLRLGHHRPTGLPRAFRPLWGGFAPLVLCALAVTLGGGFSAGLVFWVGNLLGRITPQDAPAAGRVDPVPLDPTGPPGVARPPQWPVLLDPGYFHLGAVSGVGVLVFGALLPALAAGLLRAGGLAGWALAGAGAAGGAAVVAGPGSPRWLALGVTLALTGVGAAGWRRTWRAEELRKLVACDYPGTPDGAEARALDPETRSDTIDKIATAWRLARCKYRFHWILGAAAVPGFGATIAAAALTRLDAEPLPPVGAGIGPAVLSAIAVGLVALGLRSWNNARLRLGVGILWDLLAFWPRAAHPLCPPPYGGRAVLELARRVDVLGAGPGRPAIVLSGHSQGSLICLAAVAVVDRERRDGRHRGPEFIAARTAAVTVDRLGLVTHGSQLQWAYARLFPRYVGHDVLHRLHREALGGRWRNLHRWTDPLGGPVLAWPADGAAAPVGYAETTRPWASAAGPPRPVRRRRAGHDRRLVDPLRIGIRPTAVRAPLRGHSDYFADPAYANAVREVLAADAPADGVTGGAGGPAAPRGDEGDAGVLGVHR